MRDILPGPLCLVAVVGLLAGPWIEAAAQSSTDASTTAALVTPAPGSRLRVLRATIEGTDTISARFRLDTGVFALPALPPCGQRPCAPGPALRIVRVTAPASRVPLAATVPVIIEVENRGRAAAAPVDLRLEVTGAFDSAEPDVFTVRSLRAGERVRVVRPFRVPRGGFEVLTAAIDQGGNRRPGPGAAPVQSEQFQVEGPVLQWVRLDAPTQVPIGTPLRLTFVVRNASFAATTPPIDVAFGNPAFEAGGLAAYRFVLGAIPPRLTVTATVELPDLATADKTLGLALLADPDRTRKLANVGLPVVSQSVRIQFGRGN